MRSGKAQVRRSGEVRVSRLGKIRKADRVKVTQVSCLRELKKKIEETSPNWNGVRVQREIKSLSSSKEGQEGSKDQEFGSTENWVGEKIKLS
jgi:hypothetical protein